MKGFITSLSSNPKKIFLFDALGALLTASLLYFLLIPLESHFGMPSSILQILALIALCLCLYSTSCYFIVGLNWRKPLAILIFLNSAYILYSLLNVFLFRIVLKPLGLVYFFVEVSVIILVILIEYKLFRTK